MLEPGRQIDKVGDGITNGAKGAIGGVIGAVQGAGKAVMSGLDGPFRSLTGKEGPHRIVDRVADGLASATTNALNTGLIGSVQTLAHGVTKAIDQPFEQLSGPLELPKFGKK